MAESRASRFVIREASGNNPQEVVLEGRSLPYRPTEFVGEQRMKRRDYPGSSVANVQVLGPKEEPLIVKGMFKDVFLGAGAAGGLQRRLDAIRRRGRLLRVTWSGMLRMAFLRRAAFQVLRDQDVGFELTFEVQSQGEAPAPVAASVIGSISEFLSAAQDRVDALRERALAFEQSVVSSGPLGDFLSAAQKAVSVVEDLQDSLSAVTIGADMSLDTVRDLVAHAKAAADANRDLYDQLGDMVPQAVVGPQGIEAVLRLSVSASDLAAEAREAAVMALRAEANVLSFADPAVASAVVLSPGQDLRAVAADRMGSPDAWERLADYNGLGGSDQPAGTLVLVPRG